ncbi:unnamed protein product [Dovyalis caffra]|uniref:Uncharacterized protein n=1 Tax=Dovyalis caffra TaxID=77055 RepID=A0AAV1QVA0_9ROSI|nr:unnamed protein product [Dovyalis caffra]
MIDVFKFYCEGGKSGMTDIRPKSIGTALEQAHELRHYSLVAHPNSHPLQEPIHLKLLKPRKELSSKVTACSPSYGQNKERQSKLPCRFQYELKAIHSCNEGQVFSNPICSTLNGIDWRTGFEPIEKRLFACNVMLPWVKKGIAVLS